MAGLVAMLSGAVAAVALTSAPEPGGSVPEGVMEQLPPPEYQYLGQADAPFIRETSVERGETVTSLLVRLAVSDPAALGFISSDKQARALLQVLRPGTPVVATSSRQGVLISLLVPGNEDRAALVLRRTEAGFTVEEQLLPADRRIQMVSGTIRSSLFAATDDVGLPDGVAVGLAEIFGTDIDFHRDLRKGDRFNVVYEMLYLNGTPLRTGKILAAEFVNGGKRYSAIWHEEEAGKGAYYTSEGRPLKQGFLRSPLEFSRISSGFAMRFHPVLKEWRAHKGTDFAAPTGTRVKATADGIVDFVGVQGGYGNLVVLKHDNGYSTAYGHLSGFVAGLRRGLRVAQGDVIGFVGSTGWATGPHLHYEFRINGIHHDPMKVALPSAKPLKGDALSAFLARHQPTLNRLVLLGEGALLARND